MAPGDRQDDGGSRLTQAFSIKPRIGATHPGTPGGRGRPGREPPEQSPEGWVGGDGPHRPLTPGWQASSAHPNIQLSSLPQTLAGLPLSCCLWMLGVLKVSPAHPLLNTHLWQLPTAPASCSSALNLKNTRLREGRRLARGHPASKCHSGGLNVSPQTQQKAEREKERNCKPVWGFKRQKQRGAQHDPWQGQTERLLEVPCSADQQIPGPGWVGDKGSFNPSGGY